MRKRFSVVLIFFVVLSFLPLPAISVCASESNSFPSYISEQEWLLKICLTDIYKAKAEEARIAKEYMLSVKDLARVNPSYNGELDAAKERHKKALAELRKARFDMNHIELYGTGAYLYYQDYEDYSDDYDEFSPYVSLCSADLGGPVSAIVPPGKPVKIMINGMEAFSMLSTGRPATLGAMLGLVGFAELYATYQKWHLSANFYRSGVHVDAASLSGQVKEAADFKRLDNFVQGWKPGVEAATFLIAVGDNHYIMVAWNIDGSVTVTDVYVQNSGKSVPATTKTQNADAAPSQAESIPVSSDSTEPENTNNTEVITTTSETPSASSNTISSGSDSSNTEIASSTNTTSSGILVWISDDGTRYHSKSSCSGMKNNVRQVTIEDAKNIYHRTACGKCHPPQ